MQRAKRCQRCQCFGHKTKICRTPDSKFAQDAEYSSTHNNDNCKSVKPSCVNCKRHKLNDLEHEASSIIPVLFSLNKNRSKKLWHTKTFHTLKRRQFWVGRMRSLPVVGFVYPLAFLYLPFIISFHKINLHIIFTPILSNHPQLL